MSYDLMVFDPATAPRGRAEFLAWYKDRMGSDVGLSQHTPDTLTGNLRAFYDGIRGQFPAMNGPDAYDFEAAARYANAGPFSRLLTRVRGTVPPQIDESFVTDYSLGGDLIYMNFAWSRAQYARAAVSTHVMRSDVGFFDVSAKDGMISYGVADMEAQMGL